MTTTSPPASLDEIYRAGLEALRRELGVVGMIRFLQQVRPPSGDYTAERAELHAGTTMEDVIAAIEKIQAEADQTECR
jgi:transposase